MAQKGMGMKKACFTLFALVLLAACAAGPEPIKRMAFPESEYKALSREGSGTVRGQAFLKTRGGDVKVAAGNEVLLNPVTSYSEEWYQKSYRPNLPMEPADPRMDRYIKYTTADASGRFTFRNVPAGDYFVTTQVIWEAPVGYRGAMLPQGGVITKRVTVDEGENVEVIISR